jgi:two-component system cell cycle sensor histidine kinase/response regulator CckA
MSGHEKPPGRDAVADTDDFFEMSLDNLCVAGLADGYFKRVNASWTRTLGWTAEELMARPSVEFVHPDDRASTLGGRKKLQMGSAMGPLVNRYQHKDGSYRWFEWRSIAHVDRGLVYAAARDITEQKIAEERLAQAADREKQLERQLTFADRMASVGTLANGVAHEINNPLACVAANIAMMIEELERTDDPRSDLREMASDVQVAAERIRKIVRGLYTFSRVEEERIGVIDLRPVLDLATDMTASNIRDRAHLVKDYGDTPLVDGDEARLGQVFMNLLMNAAQALPAGRKETNEIRVVMTTDVEGRAVIEIRDTGTGIPASLMGRIFDPFFTTKPVGVGTGLGLSICHTIVTGMGGDITAASEPGRGTTFRVVLPPSLASDARADAAPASDGHVYARAAILVVDDEPAVGTALARVLREHDVTVVSKAEQGLELLETGKQFAVIFSDLMMPEMSGMEFYDEVERRFPDVARRVVFVSGGAFTAQANAFLERVSNARVDKPFDPHAVRTLVQQHIAGTG